MIKRSLFIFLACTILYAIVSPHLAPIVTGANQRQGNVIRAQRYLYGSDGSWSSVIVGSSLANKIVATNLPGYYNLAFDGLGNFDGLNVLVQSKHLPKTVFIEMNEALRRQSSSLSASLFTPGLSQLRAALPFLREDSEPALLLRRVIEARKRDMPLAGTNDMMMNTVVFNSQLAYLVELDSHIPDADVIRQCFDQLSSYVNELNKRGVSIVFFEMPVDTNICQSPRAKAIRAAFYEHFPTNLFRYINQPDCAAYQTSDGMHLPPTQALKYTEYFRSQVKCSTQ